MTPQSNRSERLCKICSFCCCNRGAKLHWFGAQSSFVIVTWCSSTLDFYSIKVWIRWLSYIFGVSKDTFKFIPWREPLLIGSKSLVVLLPLMHLIIGLWSKAPPRGFSMIRESLQVCQFFTPGSPVLIWILTSMIWFYLRRSVFFSCQLYGWLKRWCNLGRN